MADQGMTAGWKEDDPAVGHAGGNILCPSGRAEPIVLVADRQTGQAIFSIGYGSCVAAVLMSKFIPAMRWLTGRRWSRTCCTAPSRWGRRRAQRGVCAEHHPGHSARHDRHQLQESQATKLEWTIALTTAPPWMASLRQVIGGDEKHQRPAAIRMTDGELQGRPGASRDADNDHLVDADA